MPRNKTRGLIYCSRCQNGIGRDVYKSSAIAGEYDTSDCYVDALIDYFGFGMKGKFDLKTDGHGGVELVPVLGT